MTPLVSREKLAKSIKACISAAFAGSIATFLVGPKSWTDQSIEAYVTGGFTTLAFGFVIILGHMLVVGMPAQYLLQAVRLRDYFSNVGLAVAATAYAFSFYIQSAFDELSVGNDQVAPRPFDPFDLPYLAFGAGLGFVIGTTAWLIRRPDRDNKSQGAKPVTPTTTP